LLLTSHIFRFLVIAQRDEFRMPMVMQIRSLHKLKLPNQRIHHMNPSIESAAGAA
jgi:hypothetical protein